MKPALLAAALAVFVLLRPAPAIAADSKPASGTAAAAAAGKEYMSAVTDKVKRTWSPIRSSKTVDIKIGFKVHSDGSVSDVRILEKTTEPINEQRAIAAIKKAAPFVAPPSVLGREPIDIVLNLTCSSILNLTVAQAIARYGEEARELLRAQCKSAGAVYPPKRIVLLALKDRKQLLMFAGAGGGAAGGSGGANQRLALVQTFPLVSYSGGLGPKLHEGDLQIPEGNYRITGSSARDMLSLAVDYPNAFDRARGLEDHRKKLGGDILIHGGSVSTGCVVVSNEQMQEVFVALHDVGFKNVQLLIAPCDLTKSQPQLNWSKQPKWLPKLYAQLKRDMSGLPIPDTGASK